jgi:hypothetical protein
VKQVRDCFREHDDGQESQADQETGMEVAPQQEHREQQQPDPSAAAKVMLGKQQSQAGEGEGQHLRARRDRGDPAGPERRCRARPAS